MKILFCSQTHLRRELGGSKVVIELAEEMERLGWQCRVTGPAEFAPAQSADLYTGYAARLRSYLLEHAAEYDVVDYDHVYLPYARAEFPRQTLFVARSVLLAHHLEKVAIPQVKTWRSRLRALVKAKGEARRLQTAIDAARRTVAEADLINVSNDDDKRELVRQGIAADKIVVIPFGIDRQRRQVFDAVSSAPPAAPQVAFIGTFDNRKGATDFPAIVRRVVTAVPAVRFRLLGTGQSEAEVLRQFPARLRPHIEVTPGYQATELPDLLATAAVGIFPSYLEGFGIGVLEMLAASVPVVAYNAPGPPMMLPPEFLVAPGDTAAMSERVIALLQQPAALAEARRQAKEQSQQFCWRRIAETTSQRYLAQLARRRAGCASLVPGH